jgi:hypothetical protein
MSKGFVVGTRPERALIPARPGERSTFRPPDFRDFIRTPVRISSQADGRRKGLLLNSSVYIWLWIGLCYRIANTLGQGFAEKVDENALAFEFRRAKIVFVQQQSIEVFYEGENVGHDKADLIVEGRVIVQVKAIQ